MSAEKKSQWQVGGFVDADARRSCNPIALKIIFVEPERTVRTSVIDAILASPCNPKRLAKLPWAGCNLADVCTGLQATIAPHRVDTLQRLQRAQQNAAGNTVR